MLGTLALDAELHVWSQEQSRGAGAATPSICCSHFFGSAHQSSFWTAMASSLPSNRVVIWPDPRIQGLTLGNTHNCLNVPLLSLPHGRQKIPMPWTKTTSTMPPSTAERSMCSQIHVLRRPHGGNRPKSTTWHHPMWVDDHKGMVVPTLWVMIQTPWGSMLSSQEKRKLHCTQQAGSRCFANYKTQLLRLIPSSAQDHPLPILWT